jgi:type I restriction enzyme S subunit
MEANTGKASAITGAARVAIGREVIVFYTSSDCKYISYLLSTPTYRRKTLALARGTTIKHVYPATFINYQIAFPSLPEQRAISAALSDVDALLNGLDRLIAKKRDIKQAAMQQLLTGRTRLPGFHDEWEAGSLASVIGALDAGVSVNSVEKDDGDIFDGMFILKTSAVVGGRFIPRECKRIALRDLSRACLNPLKGTIIISRMNTPDLVGECGYVDRDYPNLFVPDRLWMTRFKQNLHVSGLWLSYLVSSATLKRQIRAAATGTSGSMKNLSKQAFLQTPILLPSGVEQSAIASVLSDMDAELSALKVRRDKTRLLKQGMMQELLTGKTRLVRTVATHA